jgi:hypothetical protein
MKNVLKDYVLCIGELSPQIGSLLSNSDKSLEEEIWNKVSDEVIQHYTEYIQYVVCSTSGHIMMLKEVICIEEQRNNRREEE